MNISFATELFSYLVLIPAALLCFLPMKNQLRFSSKFSLFCMSSALVAMVASIVAIAASGSFGFNSLMLPVISICLVIFHILVKVPFCKSLSIYMFVIALLSFVSNLANGFDAFIHPERSIDDFSLRAAQLQLLISIIVSLLLAYPFSRYGGWLIDNFDTKSVWYAAAFISGLFFAFNLLLTPHEYMSLQNSSVFRFYWGSLITMFLLYLTLLVAYYFIVRSILSKVETDERNRILEMEESQFIKQRKYMDETQEARHDFKHAIRTLNEMIKAGDYDNASRFIKAYSDSIPANDIVRFSNNNAVNATMNYYAQSASMNKVRTDWIAMIPEKLPLTDTELCSMIGNILENAITACSDIPESERWIQFTADSQNDSQFLIVATNSFSGKVRKSKGQYLSTKRNSTGIGLGSISRTAERYGGFADFSHQGKEFYTNVMIPLK